MENCPCQFSVAERSVRLVATQRQCGDNRTQLVVRQVPERRGQLADVQTAQRRHVVAC